MVNNIEQSFYSVYSYSGMESIERALYKVMENVLIKEPQWSPILEMMGIIVVNFKG